jgi:hypothetical protein
MSQVAVYVLHKLGREGNGFNSNYKLSVERPPHLVHITFADTTNDNCKINGLWYEKDEKLTKLHLEGKDFLEVQEEIAEESKEDLISKYEELSGEKAKPIWGVKKLTEEIAKLNK